MTRHLHILVIAVLLWAVWPVEAQIYKYEDKEGNIVFSDSPPHSGDADSDSDTANPDKETEIVELSEPNTFKSDRLPYIPSPGLTNKEGSMDAEYAPVEISFPHEDQAVRQNTGNITVVVAGQTALLPGHSLLLMLDGAASNLPGSSTFKLTNLDRGTHVLRVDIVDSKQKLVLAGVPRTFHLLRFFVRN